MNKLILSIVVFLSTMVLHSMEKEKEQDRLEDLYNQNEHMAEQKAELDDSFPADVPSIFLGWSLQQEANMQAEIRKHEEWEAGYNEYLCKMAQEAGMYEKTEVMVPFPQVHLSPGIADVLRQFIDQEKEKMRGAWYRFTLYPLAQAIVKRIQEREVAVSFVIDRSNFEGNDGGDFCEALQLIAENGGRIYKKTKPRNSNAMGYFETMHHKFMIFNNNVNNKKLLWTGSFNATGQANLKNCENAVIMDDAQAIEKFEEEFKTILALSEQLGPSACTSIKTKKNNCSTNFGRLMSGIPISSFP